MQGEAGEASEAGKADLFNRASEDVNLPTVLNILKKMEVELIPKEVNLGRVEGSRSRIKKKGARALKNLLSNVNYEKHSSAREKKPFT